jgi:colanic acid biosynthesis protein WcaH
MDAPRFLPDDDFAHIVRYAPLVSIDLIIRDLEGNVLLGLRENEPAKNTYFVPGGVIRKNETIREAFMRILNAETGLTASFDEATLVGAFEHFYKTNRFGHPDYGTHYVVLTYGVSLKAQQAVAIDSQHSDHWPTFAAYMSRSPMWSSRSCGQRHSTRSQPGQATERRPCLSLWHWRLQPAGRTFLGLKQYGGASLS